MQRISRLKRELQLLGAEPPPGVSCWQTEHDLGELKAGHFLYNVDDAEHVGKATVCRAVRTVCLVLKRFLHTFVQFPGHEALRVIKEEFHRVAELVGGVNTPYEGGVFSLEIKVPERYPFEPPKIRFLTPIYHPNIDNGGRICLDALKLPPKGAWRPSLNISTVLTSIQLLMAEPNPDDPLMADISAEYKYSRQVFLEKAKKWTLKHAMQQNLGVKEMDQPDAESRVSRKREMLGPEEPQKKVKTSL